MSVAEARPGGMTAGEIAVGKARRRRRQMVDRLIDVLLLVVSCLMLLPLLFLVSNGFKTPQEMLAWPPTIIPDDPTLENFVSVLRDTPLLRWIGNSLMFAVLSTLSILATSAIAGYVLAKFPFRSLSFLFMVILATAIGNNLAGQFASEIDPNNLPAMPGQFMYLFWWGFVAGAVLLILTPFIRKMMPGVK